MFAELTTESKCEAKNGVSEQEYQQPWAVAIIDRVFIWKVSTHTVFSFPISFEATIKANCFQLFLSRNYTKSGWKVGELFQLMKYSDISSYLNNISSE